MLGAMLTIAFHGGQTSVRRVSLIQKGEKCEGGGISRSIAPAEPVQGSGQVETAEGQNCQLARR